MARRSPLVNKFYREPYMFWNFSQVKPCRDQIEQKRVPLENLTEIFNRLLASTATGTDGDIRMTPPFRTAKRWMTKRVIQDYSNQLDLFSEAAEETPAQLVSSPARRVPGVSVTRPARPHQLAFDGWEPLLPEDVQQSRQ